MVATLTNAPVGLLVNRVLQSSPTNYGQANIYYIKNGVTSAIGFGDAVIRDSATNVGYILPYSSAGTHILGVFQGCWYYNTTVTQWIFSNQFPSGGASTAGDIGCYVVDDPNAIFMIQYIGSPAPSYVGKNIEITSNGSPTAATGISTAYGSGINTTSTLPLRVVGLSQRFMPGADPTTWDQVQYGSGQFPVNGWLEVKMNTSEMTQTTGL